MMDLPPRSAEEITSFLQWSRTMRPCTAHRSSRSGCPRTPSRNRSRS